MKQWGSHYRLERKSQCLRPQLFQKPKTDATLIRLIYSLLYRARSRTAKNTQKPCPKNQKGAGGMNLVV